MHVVQMRGIITIIAYRMFPEPPLPNSAFASGPANRRQSLGCRQRFGKCNLDCFPANRIVGVTRRKAMRRKALRFSALRYYAPREIRRIVPTSLHFVM